MVSIDTTLSTHQENDMFLVSYFPFEKRSIPPIRRASVKHRATAVSLIWLRNHLITSQATYNSLIRKIVSTTQIDYPLCVPPNAMSPTKTTNDASILQGIEDTSHELTNVLQIIRGYISFAHKNLSKEHENRIDLEQALIATDRAAKIAHHLLETARNGQETKMRE